MLISIGSNSKAFSQWPCHNPYLCKNLLLQLSPVNTSQDRAEALRCFYLSLTDCPSRLTHINPGLTKVSVWRCSLHLYHQGWEWSASTNLSCPFHSFYQTSHSYSTGALTHSDENSWFYIKYIRPSSQSGLRYDQGINEAGMMQNGIPPPLIIKRLKQIIESLLMNPFHFSEWSSPFCVWSSKQNIL